MYKHQAVKKNPKTTFKSKLKFQLSLYWRAFLWVLFPDKEEGKELEEEIKNSEPKKR